MTQPNVSEELLHIRKRARRRLLGAIALVLFALIVLWTVLDNAPPPQFATGHPIEITSSAPALAANAPVVAVVQPAGGPESSRVAMEASSTAASLVAAAPNQAPVVAASAVIASVPAKNTPVQPKASSVATVLPGKLVNHQTPVKAATAPEVKPKRSSAVAEKAVVDPRKILDGLEEKKTAPAVAKTGRYYLQVGAFADAAKAAQLIAKLKAAGLPAYGEKVGSSKGELTRIRIGPSTDEARANEWRRKSEAAGVPGKVIKQ